MFRIVRVLLLGGIVGKVLGIFRELLGAWLFGTGLVAGAFRLSQSAFLIPLHGFVSDAVNGGFTPNFSVWRETHPQRASALFAGMHAVLLGIGMLVGLLLFFVAPIWVKILAPGFSMEASQLATNMVRILALALPSYALVNLYAAAELVTGRGVITAARASIQSIGLIVGTVLAWWLNQPLWIPVGFVAGYIYLSIWGLYAAKAAGLAFNPFYFQAHDIKESLLSAWRIFRVLLWVPVILQINQIIERRVGSVLDPESIAGLDYARFITDTLVVLIAVPFGAAGQATMASLSQHEFEEKALATLRILLIIGIPISLMIAVNAELIVRIIFERGAFDAHSVQVTSAIITGQAIAIFAALIAYAAQRYLNARGQNKSVLFATASGAIVSIGMNLLLGPYLGVSVLGFSGAAMACVIAFMSVHRLGLFKPLFPDVVMWIVLISISVIFLKFLGYLISDAWLQLVFNLLFWISICAMVRRVRQPLLDMYHSIRHAAK